VEEGEGGSHVWERFPYLSAWAVFGMHMHGSAFGHHGNHVGLSEMEREGRDGDIWTHV
jgi:hypothetical protein